MNKTVSCKESSKVIYQEGKKTAWILTSNPSENELLLKGILDEHNVKYKFQKIFFKSIEGKKKCAESYYIAPFWLPRKKLIIEVSPSKRDKVSKNMNFRIYNALEAFPKAQCIKLTKKDLTAPGFIKDFIDLIK